MVNRKVLSTIQFVQIPIFFHKRHKMVVHLFIWVGLQIELVTAYPAKIHLCTSVCPSIANSWWAEINLKASELASVPGLASISPLSSGVLPLAASSSFLKTPSSKLILKYNIIYNLFSYLTRPPTLIFK